jgi:hypothetical protein
MSTQEQIETLEQRVERELGELRASGFLKKPLPTITRSTLYKIPSRLHMEFFKAGGKVTDDPPAPKKPLPEGGMTRTKFLALSPQDQMKFIKASGRVFDDEDVFEPKEKAESEVEAMRRKLKGKLQSQGMSEEDVDALFETEGQE